MPDLSTRHVLVLGGGRGIGRALCETLLEGSARVAVLDRDADALGWAEGRAGATTAVLDMTDRAAVKAHFAQALRAGTVYDTAVIAAAIHGGCPAAAMQDAFIDRLLDVNLGAHMAFVRELLPVLCDGGRVIGISSNAAQIGIPMESAYAATKAGLERYYEALALELADRRVRPVIVQVGNVNTGFNETGNDYAPAAGGYTDATWAKVMEKIDSRHGMPPEEVARAIARLITAERPPLRALVGANAKKTYWATRLLGTGLALKLVGKLFGLDKPA